MATAPVEQIYQQVLVLLLRPLVRYCLRHSKTIQDLVDAAKEVFVQMAAEDLKRKGAKINVSRLSILTGVHRTEVTRVTERKEKAETGGTNPVGKVLAYWGTVPRYRTSQGKPRVLSYGGENSEFATLVRDVTKSVHPSAVAFQLKNMGMVEETPRGMKLKGYLRTFERDPLGGFELVASDMESLLSAGAENISGEKDPPNLHIRTVYDNVVLECESQVRDWLIEEGKAFHKRARNYLAQFDKDTNPDLEDKEGGLEVALGAFSFSQKRQTGKK